MALNVAVQMDPIDKINIAGDSTFALLIEARARGHRLSYYTPDKLSLRDGRVVAETAPVEVRDLVGDHFTLGGTRTTELGLFDVVLLRQDPPFDLAYITSTHLLEQLQPRVLIVNDPASVRNAPEKLFVMNFPQLMPPTLITRDREAIEAFLDQHGDAVMKPLHGHGGAAVFKIARSDPNFGSLYDLFAASFREPWVVQRFLRRVADGDKRIILVDGVAAGAVNRVPAGNDIRANLARGATASAAEFTPREREICAVIGPELKRRGLLFAGIDVIDGNLTEINVTSPTGIRAIKRLGGPDLAVAIWDAIEAKLRRGSALSFTETETTLEESRGIRRSPGHRNP
ncbi:MAG: glutathione synthase [Methylocella sp.]|nr:MAG: glutathione synthase [Hyphomicrobiales bacterium]